MLARVVLVNGITLNIGYGYMTNDYSDYLKLVQN
jgi:hypothetical protein